MNATGTADRTAESSLFDGLAALAAAEDLTVGKDGFNSYFNYGYMTEASLFTAARAALASVGMSGTITFSEGSIEHITTAHRDDNGNTNERPAIMAFVKATLWLRAADGLGIECSAYGQGIDPADKAMAKAQTMAAKYVVQKALMIAVESDDVDSSASQGTAQRSAGGGKFATERQLGFLCSLVKKLHLAESNDAMEEES